MPEYDPRVAVIAAGLFVDGWVFGGNQTISDRAWVDILSSRDGLTQDNLALFFKDYKIQGYRTPHNFIDFAQMFENEKTSISPSPENLVVAARGLFGPANQNGVCHRVLASKLLFFALPNKKLAIYDTNTRVALHKLRYLGSEKRCLYGEFLGRFECFLEDYRGVLTGVLHDASPLIGPVDVRWHEFLVRRLADKYLWIIGREHGNA